MTGPMRIFPRGLVGGDGRRLRLGSFVHTEGTPERRGEVTGWAGPRRGVEVHFHGTDTVETVVPTALFRVDEEQFDPVTVGWVSVEDDLRPTLLVVPVGTRELVVRPDDPGPFSPVANGDVRSWTKGVSELLAVLSTSEQLDLVRRHLDAPMLRRLLDEATLPEAIHRLLFLATDQVHPQPGDTTGMVPLLLLWLRSRGHFDDEGAGRPILEVAEPAIIRRLPHILDAVVHQVSPSIVAAGTNCERGVVSIAGGTPAMTYGATIAVSRRFGGSNTRLVQIPQSFAKDGEWIDQPLIEMDLADTALHDTGNS